MGARPASRSAYRGRDHAHAAMLIAAKSIPTGGSNKKLRSPSTMRASMFCAGSAARWRKKPSAPPKALNSIGRQEEGVPEFDTGSREVAEIIEPLGVVGHDGVPEAEGGPGEFLGDARICARIETVVGVKEVRPEQLRQEFIVSDVCDLGPDDGPRFLVQMIAFPVRVLGFERGPTWKLCSRTNSVCNAVSGGIFLRPHVAGHHGCHLATIGRLLPSDTFMCPSSKP